jgi:hypothetical protein
MTILTAYGVRFRGVWAVLGFDTNVSPDVLVSSYTLDANPTSGAQRQSEVWSVG